MKITMRQSALFVMALQTLGTLLLLLLEIGNGFSTYLVLLSSGLVVFAALWYSYWRGWQPARALAVGFVTILFAFGIQEPFITQTIPLSILLAPILAMILVGVRGVVASAAVLLVVLLIRAGGQGVYADPVNLVIYAMVFGGMVLSRLVTDTARAEAETNAARAEQSSLQNALHAQELAEANELMETQLEQQQQLLNLVTTLETPTLTLADGVLIAPVVGHIDTRRAEALTERLLADASATRARLVILDIAGVAVMDTSVARALLNTAQALRLLGCKIALSGISAQVALTLTELGVNLSGINTARSPQEALSQWLNTADGAPTNGNARQRLN